MKSISSLSFFLLLSVLLVQVTAQNVTKTCQEVNPTCDGNGVCMRDGLCRCFTAYYGDWINGTRDVDPLSCAQRAYYDINGYKEGVIALLCLNAFLYTISFLMALYRLIIEFKFSSDDFSRTITKYVLILILINSFFLWLQSLDYWGNLGVLGSKFYYVLNDITHPVFVMIFCALLFHWVELYERSVKHLKREEMLRKLRQDYEGKVTMEDILVKISFMQKFKYFYVVLGLSTCALFIIDIVVELKTTFRRTFIIMNIFFYVYFVAIWIAFGVAFVLYGIRLMRIMPASVGRKIRENTVLIVIFMVSAFFNNMLNIAVEASVRPRDTLKDLWVPWLSLALESIGMYAALFMYIPIWQWHQWFNPEMIRSLLSSSKTSNKSGASNLSGDSHPAGGSVEPLPEIALEMNNMGDPSK